MTNKVPMTIKINKAGIKNVGLGLGSQIIQL